MNIVERDSNETTIQQALPSFDDDPKFKTDNFMSKMMTDSFAGVEDNEFIKEHGRTPILKNEEDEKNMAGKAE